MRVRGTTAAAVAAGAVLLSGCSFLDREVARVPTITGPAPITTAASLALPDDLCAAMDPALFSALVPDLEELTAQPRRSDASQDDTGCRTTGGTGSVSVAIVQYRLALTSAEEMADDWLRATCSSSRARVLADGLGSRSCTATTVETSSSDDGGPDHGAVVGVRVGGVVVQVDVRNAAAAVDTEAVRAVAQAALDAVPDLPEAEDAEDVEGSDDPAARLPEDLCAALPGNLRDYVVPAVTSSRTGGTASGATVSATCSLENRQQTPEPDLPADTSVEVVAHGPELGFTAEQAAERTFDTLCVGRDPVDSDLGDEECTRDTDDADGTAIRALTVRTGTTVVHATYVHSPLSPGVAAPGDPARLVADAVLSAL